MQNKTKIIATVGPRTSDVPTLKRLITAGMSVARLNFSHGEVRDHELLLQNIRQAATSLNTRVGIIQDLPGPKIRTGELKTPTVTLVEGKTIILTTKNIIGSADMMTVHYKPLCRDVSPGTIILLNDGLQAVKVISVETHSVTAKIITGGEIAPRRGVHITGTTLSVKACTKEDKEKVLFGIKHKVEYVALSFVQRARDIEVLRSIIKKHNSPIKIISKIETSSAIEFLDEIIQASDAVMIARGDLAIEMGSAMVPVLQKQITRKAREHGVPVIVATQMLESMTHELVPTRAEASDVSNAVSDGVDAVMLSGETAVGDYPIETVTMMSNIIAATEKIIDYKTFGDLINASEARSYSTASALAQSARTIGERCRAKALVVFSETGFTVREQSAMRPAQPIIVRSGSDYVLNQSCLLFGVIPELATINMHDQKKAIESTSPYMIRHKIAKKGDTAVVISGSVWGLPGGSNTISIVSI